MQHQAPHGPSTGPRIHDTPQSRNQTLSSAAHPWPQQMNQEQQPWFVQQMLQQERDFRQEQMKQQE